MHCVLYCTDTKQCKQHPVYGRMGTGRSVRSWFLLILPFSRTDSRDLGPEGAPGIHFMLDVVFEINFDRSFKQDDHDLKYEAKVLPFSQNQMYCWCWRSTHKRSDLACLETFAKIVTSNHGGIRYNIQQDYQSCNMSKNNKLKRVALRCHRRAAQTGPNVWGFRSPDIDNHGQIHTTLLYVHTLQFVCKDISLLYSKTWTTMVK